MKIVPQSVKSLCSLVPVQPVALLPAPRIAGLLPAWASREYQPPPKTPPIILFSTTQPRSHVYRSFAEWDAAEAELDMWLEGAHQRLTAVRAEIERETQSRLAALYAREGSRYV